jgi:hypothetical protein
MAFRSPRPSPRIDKQHILDVPIQDFTTVIESTVSEDWQRRTAALQALLSTIPSSYGSNGNTDDGNRNGNGNENENENNQNHLDAWYTSPPTLRHLAMPLAELIKDARSTVVKRTCDSLVELFSKCKTDARYLFKDLMPTVCSAHASTVKVIRNYVQTMVLESITYVYCKMSMPIWLDRLKHDKSRTVREACSLYLTTAMSEWGATSDDDFNNDNNGYLSYEIYLQVGTILVKSLSDPSPIVRQNCKKGLEVVSTQQGDVIDGLVNDRSLTRDLRAKKLLKRLQEGDNIGDDNISIASRMSRGGASVASAPVVRSGRYGGSSGNSYHRSMAPRHGNNRGVQPFRVPTTIGVTSPPPLPPSSKVNSGLGPPRRMVKGISSSSSTTSTTSTRPVSNSTEESLTPSPATPIQPSSFSTPTQDNTATPPHFKVQTNGPNNDENNNNINATDLGNKSFDSTPDTPLKPIANAEELRQAAKTRTGMSSSRRSSLLLQDRFSKTVLSSSQIMEGVVEIDDKIKSVTDMMDVAHLKEDEIADHPNLPFHTKIAHELLEGHKHHVDDLMQILKVEMEMLKDFELIMLEQGPRRPTEEEVLEYFESLGLCLEQRKKAGKLMQKKMDSISEG